MTSNPYIIARRAASIEDLGPVFELIFAKRLEHIADIVEPTYPAIAELARSYASEHRMVADRLSGAVLIGAGEDEEEAA